MLQAWVMRGTRHGAAASRRRRAADELMTLLDGAGFTSVVATNCEQEYDRMLHLGDHLQTTHGHRVGVRREARPASASATSSRRASSTAPTTASSSATMLFRILKFKPGTGRSAAAAAAEAEAEQRAAVAAAARAHARQRVLVRGRTASTGCSSSGARSCGTLRHPPRPTCAECRSYEWDARRGERPRHRLQLRREPLPAGAGVRLPARRSGSSSSRRARASSPTSSASSPADIAVGMPVEVEWVDHDPDLTLPAFRPSRPKGHSDGLHVLRRAGRGPRPGRADLPGLGDRRAGQGDRGRARSGSTASCGARWPTPTCSASPLPEDARRAAGSASSSCACCSSSRGASSRRCRLWPTVVLRRAADRRVRHAGAAGSVAARRRRTARWSSPPRSPRPGVNDVARTAGAGHARDGDGWRLDGCKPSRARRPRRRRACSCPRRRPTASSACSSSIPRVRA